MKKLAEICANITVNMMMCGIKQDTSRQVVTEVLIGLIKEIQAEQFDKVEKVLKTKFAGFL
jgi:hypothetical protein